MVQYAELHCHSNFSFLDGASSPDELVERAVALGLTGLGVTDHQGLYGSVRFAAAAEAAGIHPVIGAEIELLDPLVPDPDGVVVPARRRVRRGGRRVTTVLPSGAAAIEGVPDRPRPERARLPGHREPVKEDHRGIGERQRGAHLVLLAADASGWRSLSRLISRANLAGTKAAPQFRTAALAEHAEGVVALSGCREGEIARRLRVGDRSGARAAAAALAERFPGRFHVELSHHLLPDDDWLLTESVALARELGLPVVVTNDVHYALPEGREFHDVLTAIRHGRTLDTLDDLRRPDSESYLKTGADLLLLPPGDGSLGRDVARAWREGIEGAAALAAACSVDLEFEQYRFPGFPVPDGETPFSYLSELCWAGARRRYHPLTSAVVTRLAHELDVIERAGLAEFFLICWDLMRFAKEQGIPAQGRGSATSSIVSYTLGISRVEPIAHNLLFERFINPGRTTYPDVDIDFSSERREEVIQYIYGRYGPEHTGMVCNLVTYRARSAVREVGYALGFPRPLVDRVAKALETYDSVMVRRDLEADGGFAEFFRRAGEGTPAEAIAAEQAESRGLVDGMGQLQQRVPLVGKVPPWKQPPKPADPNAPQPFRWLLNGEAAVPAPEPAPAPLPEPIPLGEVHPDVGGSQDVSAGTSRAGAGPRRAGNGPVSTASSPSSPGFTAPSGTEANKAASGESSPVAGPDLLAQVAGPGASTMANRTHSWSEQEGGRQGGPSSDRDPRLSPIQGPGTNGGDSLVDSGTGTAAGAALSTSVVPAAEMGAIRGAPTAPNPLHGPSRSGMWEGAPESPPSIRPGGRHDDEGGPGDTPASVAWLRSGKGTGYAQDRDKLVPPALVEGRQIDPESGMPEPPPRQTDRLGRPNRWDPPAPRTQTMGRGGDSKVARVEPESPAQPMGGSTAHLSDWERWLEFCARIDGFPRHLSIHSGGMLVTAAPLIDIAPIERATMKDRVVVQFDKRDVEELKLIKLDLLGLGMLSAIDETLQLIEHDCAVCLDLDKLPEEIPEVFDMLQAADTVGVFQVESRAQMQTLPKSRPTNLDDLVVEVAIIRPGPIQGNAVHPYLRRKQGIEPVEYLHPSLEPVLNDTLGVILYQEQVMRIAIEVAGFSPAESDGFRRAMGTWRSTREMEKLHQQFFEGCLRQPGMTVEMAEELFRQVAAFASFGFAKSHAAAFARTAYESSFLKLFYPAQFLVGLINAQPMGFYPVEVLVNDAKRHGVAILPVDINRSRYKTTTEWAGRPGWATGGEDEPLPGDAGIERRPDPVESAACVMPSREARDRWSAESAVGWGVRLGMGLVKGIGEEHEQLIDAELTRGPYTSLADVVERTDLPEETLERLIRVGALDSLGRPRRELLWQLREVAGSVRGSIAGRVAGRPIDLRLPPTDAPALPALTESERIGDAYAVVGLDARRQVVSLYRSVLDRLGAVPNSDLAAGRPGRVRIGGLVVTRQHPMTAKGTVFLALEDETGMVNVTLWPDTWARLRGVVRRHALLLVDGELQRQASVVNVVAHDVRTLVEVAASVGGGPDRPEGVRQMGHAGMRRLG
ncbi:MAG TPA: PHP domain-containing protein [Candidatus Limnocylindrales bacterium]|nr:PHP domain-containing protein [Candidatus Limnocylindrales bacterium]